MRYYCNHCRTITDTEDLQKVVTGSSSMIRGVCARCGRVKTLFTSNHQ